MSQEQQGSTEAVEVRPSENQSGFPKAELTGDFTTDIQNIAREQGVVIGSDGTTNPAPAEEQSSAPSAEVVTERQDEPSQPTEDQGSAEADATQEAKPDVPEKFQKEDGSVDAEKVKKSTEAALARYAELERQLKQKQNEVNRVNVTPTSPQPQPQLNDNVSLDNIAKQIEDEIKLNGTGVALAKLMNAAEASAYERAKQDLLGVQGEIESQKQRVELKRIAEQDDWVLSEKGFDVLSKVRQENPWIDTSPSPWQTALEIAKGRGLAPQTRAVNGSSTPKPGGQIVTPPSGSRAVEQPKTQGVNDMSKSDLFAKLDKMTKQEEDAFWRSQGVNPWQL